MVGIVSSRHRKPPPPKKKRKEKKISSALTEYQKKKNVSVFCGQLYQLELDWIALNWIV